MRARVHVESGEAVLLMLQVGNGGLCGGVNSCCAPCEVVLCYAVLCARTTQWGEVHCVMWNCAVRVCVCVYMERRRKREMACSAYVLVVKRSSYGLESSCVH